MVKRAAGAAGMHRRFNEQALKRVSGSATEPSTEHITAATTAGPAVPTHLRKKLARRMKFLDKVKNADTLSSLSAKKTLKKKKRRQDISQALTSLGTLSAALDSAADEAAQTADRRRKLAGKGSCKKRTSITTQETLRLQQVLAHPQYQADPIAAIQSQLQATLPAAPPLPKAVSLEGQTGRRKIRSSQT